MLFEIEFYACLPGKSPQPLCANVGAHRVKPGVQVSGAVAVIRDVLVKRRRSLTVRQRINCISKVTVHGGIGHSSQSWFLPCPGAIGTRLADGSAILVIVPGLTCEMRKNWPERSRSKGRAYPFQPDPAFVPLIAWAASGDPVPRLDLFMAREALGPWTVNHQGRWMQGASKIRQGGQLPPGPSSDGSKSRWHDMDFAEIGNFQRMGDDGPFARVPGREGVLTVYRFGQVPLTLNYRLLEFPKVRGSGQTFQAKTYTPLIVRPRDNMAVQFTLTHQDFSFRK